MQGSFLLSEVKGGSLSMRITDLRHHRITCETSLQICSDREETQFRHWQKVSEVPDPSMDHMAGFFFSCRSTM